MPLLNIQDRVLTVEEKLNLNAVSISCLENQMFFADRFIRLLIIFWYNFSFVT